MKRLFAATALALALIGGAVTTAQADNRDRHEHRYDRRDDRRDDRHDYRRDDRRDYRRDERHYDRYAAFRHHDGRRYDYGRYVRPSGYHYRSWGYGQRLPPAYYGRRYIVNDYYSYRLGPPPRGYHWVRVDNDVVLAAIASGLVVEAVYGIFD
jgi:Ni/Co efflux regulator RcnB